MSDGENASVNEVATKKKAWPAAHDEMQSLIDDFDWSPTPLGPMENWSPTLKIMVPFLLRNRFPLLLWWGPQYVSIYNEAYRPVLGAKHPWALGKPVSECWSEIWHVLKPLIDTPFNGGPATWNDDIELEINRHGFPEETHFTIAYSPVPDETAANGIGGVLATVTEISEKVIGERRIVVLRDLASRSGDARTPDEACAIATETFKKHERDVPFALLYLVEPGRKRARLSGLAGLKPNQALCPAKVELAQQDSSAGWHFGAELNPILVDDLGRRFPPSASKNHPNLPHTAVVLPLPAANARDAAGFLVVGINPRLKLDEHYHDFLHLMRAQMASAIANAQSYEDERKRSEALAEIDKAKTVFFSNVSHEFRTPITLMLGHIEDLLARSGERPDDRDRLLIAHRNSLRLLKLVNTLLEFSRIEAGRLQARFEPTNLATATAELASAFRSAMEMAGLNLTVDTPPLPEPAYVDRQMWEKIVLNLLSNAFKFTLKGDVAVKLAAGDDNFVLTVRDTGIGIPANEMPRLFERFHRVEGARGRSQEGSGIGLALVQELVKLHGGTVSAESHLDEGTTICVTIPKGSRAPAIHRNGEGSGHGNGEDRSSTTIGAVPFVEEALQWLPDHPSSDAGLPEVEPAPHPAQTRNGGRRTLLVVDDNADMRDYLRRLLGAQYDLKIVGNGEDALAAVASQKPNLIVTDIMMPGFDGIELLRRLRADTRTNTVPVILLSARAGEESRIEGMQAGADDYLIKPFSARELLARIEAHLKISQYRTEVAETLRASEERFRALVTASSDVVYRMGPDWREMRFLQGKDFVADTDEPSDSWLETYIPAEDQTLMLARISDAIDSKAVFEMEHRVIRRDGSIGWTHSRAIPMLDGKGDIAEWFGAARDITDRKRAEETQQRLLSELSHRVKNMLASVQAIAQHTLRSAKDPADFAASFSGRLQSMSRMHSLLTRTAWEGADLDDIIRDQLLWGTADERRVTISGPPVRFDAQTATHMAMVLHELGTNAAKHGALSLNKGTVSIDWSVTGGALCLNWTERGGPPLKAPLGRGFGTRLIEKVATGGGGSARLTTEADGMRWEVRLEATVTSIAAHAAIAIDNAHLLKAAENELAIRRQAERAAQQLAAIVESSEDAILSMDLDGIITSWNVGAERLYGYTVEEAFGSPVTLVIPEDRLGEELEILAKVRAGQRVDHFETVRQRKDGGLIPISLRISPIRDSTGVVVGASKIARDISERRQAEQQKDLLIQEMAHRVKNLFMVSSSVVSLSAKAAASAEELASAVVARLGSLARAHVLTLPTPDRDGAGEGRANLQALLSTLLSPYDGDTPQGLRRVTTRGCDLGISRAAITGFSLVVHEFATNAAKYGALSTASGSLDIECIDCGDTLELKWTERGGPQVSRTDTEGFGTKLAKLTIERQFGGEILRQWHSQGLTIRLIVPKDRLQPPE